MKVVVAGALLCAMAGAVLVRAQAQSADEQEIRRVVSEYYFEGGRQGDSSQVRRAFNLEVAHMLYVDNEGALRDVPIPEYVRRIGAARERPDFRPDASPRRILMVDVSGSAAVAKLEIQAPEVRLVDYMSLLKVNGRWQIVNKIFSRMPAGE